MFLKLLYIFHNLILFGIVTSNHKGIVLSVFSKSVVNTNVKDHVLMGKNQTATEVSRCLLSIFVIVL